MPERLHKVIAEAGFASRRKAERMIEEGLVEVNGRVVRAAGVKVDPARDLIRVNGRPLVIVRKKAYFIFNKPKGCVTTLSDEKGRRSISDLIEGIEERVFPVGRLDYNAEGAIILTNDGELAHKLMHPSFGVEREYEVKVRGRIGEKEIGRLLAGIKLEDGPAKARRARLLGGTGANSWAFVCVTEGRNRLVKRMFEKLGFPVVKLRRTTFAGLRCDGMRPGEIRELSRAERAALRSAAGFHQEKQGRQRRSPEK